MVGRNFKAYGLRLLRRSIVRQGTQGLVLVLHSKIGITCPVATPDQCEQGITWGLPRNQHERSPVSRRLRERTIRGTSLSGQGKASTKANTVSCISGPWEFRILIWKLGRLPMETTRRAWADRPSINNTQALETRHRGYQLKCIKGSLSSCLWNGNMLC